MDALSFKLPNFEGPLDLLLYLVQKNKLDITDIPISLVLEQYMDTIQKMHEVDMEVASEFLDMAARLVQIKSTMLLPRHEEETEEMRRQLSGELIEYRLCREIADKLSLRYIGGDLYVRDPANLPKDSRYRLQHSPALLVDGYLQAAGRGRRRLPPPAQAFSQIVARKAVSVSSKIAYVLRRLYLKHTVPYGQLFAESKSRSELVATFLAVLELMKSKRITVTGNGDSARVTIWHTQSGEQGGEGA